MRTKKSNILQLILKISILSFFSAIVLSCEKDKIETDQIYFSSFENESDLNGWTGSFELRHEVPVSGGQNSIYVSGGCIIPHAYLEFGPFETDMKLSIECWGKNLDIGGGVSLFTKDYNSSIYLSIQEKNWKHYSTDSILFCPAGKKIQINLSSGGLIPSSMLIDMIKIVEK